MELILEMHHDFLRCLIVLMRFNDSDETFVVNNLANFSLILLAEFVFESAPRRAFNDFVIRRDVVKGYRFNLQLLIRRLFGKPTSTRRLLPAPQHALQDDFSSDEVGRIEHLLFFILALVEKHA